MIFLALLVFFALLNNWIVKHGNITLKYRGVGFALLILAEAAILYLIGSSTLS